MVWTDLVTLALLTIILTIVIPKGPLLWFACALLGLVAGIYRGHNPKVKK